MSLELRGRSAASLAADIAAGVATVANPMPNMALLPLDFRASTGTVSTSAANSWTYLSFANTTGNTTSASGLCLPRDWNTFDMQILWFNVGAGAGDVDWRMDVGTLGAGETLANPTNGSVVRITAGATNVLIRSTLRTGIAVPAAGKDLIVRLTRAGNTDTLANAAGVVSVRLVKVS